MATKICKSCGAEYKGEYCDKCGYGKPGVTSHSLEKLKNEARQKPVRHMTPEEKEAYYAELKQKRISVNKKKKKVKASKRAVLIFAALMCFIVFVSLVATGTISFTSKTKSIESYFRAIEEKDYTSFAASLHSEIRKQYDSDISELGTTKDKYMSDYYCKDLEERYGEGFKISVELDDPEKLSDDETKEITEESGVRSVKSPYRVDAKVTFSGSIKTETADLSIYVSSESGAYKIFYLKAAEIPFTDAEMSQGGTNESESASASE